ncbi:hypothetical protein C8J57DRAFT_1479283 [Mycena rebaudengoi]|nr:hypothetical protein C8J57DRAFT_1479283 [Mycena rebaudengoi]
MLVCVTLITLALLACQFCSIGVVAVASGRSLLAERDALSDSGLTSALWIWAAPLNQSIPPLGNVAFMRSFSAPAGKGAYSAIMTISAVNNFTAWVNGNPVGSSTNGAGDWKTARVLTAPLELSTANIFSILVSTNSDNFGSPEPGLLAAIKIKYTDGSTTTIHTDADWEATTNIANDFPTSAAALGAAKVGAAFGSGSWGNSVTLASTDPSPLDLSAASWIWSDKGADLDTPVGILGFRKTVPTASGKTAQTALILVTVDNAFNLYVNGEFVGSPAVSWSRARQFTVALSPDSNTFTVIGQNTEYPGQPNPAGFIAAIKITHTDGTSQIIGTDASWLRGNFTNVTDNAFPLSQYTSTFMSTADSGLFPAVALGKYPMEPWGAGVNTFDALNAALIPSSPFTRLISPPPRPGGSPPPTRTIIAIVIPVVVVIALILGFLFWLRRRRSRSPDYRKQGASIPFLTASSTGSYDPVYTPLQPYPFTVPHRPPHRPSLPGPFSRGPSASSSRPNEKRTAAATASSSSSSGPSLPSSRSSGKRTAAAAAPSPFSPGPSVSSSSSSTGKRSVPNPPTSSATFPTPPASDPATPSTLPPRYTYITRR